MKHIFFFVVLIIITVLAYEFYTRGAFGQGRSKAWAAGPAQPATTADGAAQQADAQRAPNPESAASAPQEQPQPKPGDVVAGVVSSGKRVGKGASKAFGSVNFGGQ